MAHPTTVEGDAGPMTNGGLTPQQFIDGQRYPITRLESSAGQALVARCRSRLDQDGACVLEDFLLPDAAARALLWERLLPPVAPRASDLDIASLGEAVNLTGGEIRNAALHAAFLAAETDRPIGLPEITLAVWRELSKSGRDLTPSDLGPLAPHFPEGGLLC